MADAAALRRIGFALTMVAATVTLLAITAVLNVGSP
jgi:hypothetical protein